MKTLNYAFYIIILSAFFLASCTNTQHEEDTNHIEFIVEDFLRGDASTRTAITLPDNDVDPAGFIWTAGDTIGIAPSEGSQIYFVINESGANSSSASFSGGAWALKSTEDADYAAYYPFIGDIYLDRTEIPVNYSGQVYIPAENNVLTSLALYDYMAAKPSKASSSTNVSFHFSHLGAMVEFQLAIPKEAEVKSLTITSPSAVFALDGYYDLTAETLAIQPNNENLTKTFTIQVEDLSVQAAETFSIFCMMCPVDISGVDLTATITYGENNETRQCALSRGKNMKAGRWYTLRADNTLNVTFDANGGEGTMTAQTYEVGVSQALHANEFTREGYIFTAWNTATDGSGTSYTDQQSIILGENTTLYAQWGKDNSGNGDSYVDWEEGENIRGEI